MDNFDIICNQEIFDFVNLYRKQKLVTYAQKAGFLYFCNCDPAPLFSNAYLDGGLMILSRFPIVEHEFKPYRYGTLSDAMTHKGVLYAKIDVAGRILHLF